MECSWCYLLRVILLPTPCCLYQYNTQVKAMRSVNAQGIPFTQYLQPNGRQREERFTIASYEIKSLAQEVIDFGWVFECELLTTGLASLTVSDGEEDKCVVLVKNGPEMIEAVEKLVVRAHALIV